MALSLSTLQIRPIHHHTIYQLETNSRTIIKREEQYCLVWICSSYVAFDYSSAHDAAFGIGTAASLQQNSEGLQ